MGKIYIVDDPSEYKHHTFLSFRDLESFLYSEGNFDGDPYDEVTVYKAVKLTRPTSEETL